MLAERGIFVLMAWIYDIEGWPKMSYSTDIIRLLSDVRNQQGKLYEKVTRLDESLQNEAKVELYTEDVVNSSAIEEKHLNPMSVRKSLRNRLGLDQGGLLPKDRDVEGIVKITLDATENNADELSKDRLCSWHSLLFPTQWSEGVKIVVGDYRPGEMHVMSGAYGKEKIHFTAPSEERVSPMMEEFIEWFNSDNDTEPILKASIAHLWFITIHPFDDGNGRIARGLTDMLLARAEDSKVRYYSMSASIKENRQSYYDKLEYTQGLRNSLDITPWIQWFLEMLQKSLANSEKTLSHVLALSNFWDKYTNQVNERQRKFLKRVTSTEWIGNITSKKFEDIAKAPPSTARKDILDLVTMGALKKEEGGSKKTNYSVNFH